MSVYRAAISAVLLTFAGAAASADTVSLPLTDDAWINAKKPASNYGATRSLVVHTWGPKEALVRFDSTAIRGELIDQAILKLRLADIARGGFISVYPMTSTWSEDSVTWITQPTTESKAIDTVNVTRSDRMSDIEFDVTDVASRWADGSLPDFGLVIRTSNDIKAVFDTEWTGVGGADSAARLEVQTGSEPNVVRNPDNGHFYRLIEAPSGLDWHAARSAAEKTEYEGMPGYLATLTTDEEHAFVASQFQQLVPQSVWLGANDLTYEGWFEWVTGESWRYGIGLAGAFANWGPGQPDGGTSENCLLIVNGSNSWGDEPCDNEHSFYLVEYSTPILGTYISYGAAGSGGVPYFEAHGYKPRLVLILDESGECDGPPLEILFGDSTVPFSDMPQTLIADHSNYANFGDFIDGVSAGKPCLEVTADVMDIFGNRQWGTGGSGTTATWLSGAEIVRIEFWVGDENRVEWRSDNSFITTRTDFAITFYGTAAPTISDVDIDIKPGIDRNGIDLADDSRVWVSVLSAYDFDPLQIDESTVRFGPNGASSTHSRVMDRNGDGLADIEFKFVVRDTGIKLGDREATISGQTVGGRDLTGTDKIKPWTRR